VAQLEAALVAEPARADLLNRLAIAQRRLGRFAEARATYAQAIAIDPLLADAELNLAVLLDLYLGDPDAALPHYERYLLLTGGSTDEEARSWLAELHTRLGRVQRTAETAP
jgi:tetratricopeptide (TPR) repeat protein